MKIKNRYYFFTVALLISTLAFAQRDTIPVNSEWQFSIDKKAVGLTEKWYEGNLSNARGVKLPHTWNVEEANQNHYGWGWYQKKINIPTDW
ncbi:MAG: sugar-binding domain-containing protein, partial [Ferruginibacter sp.]